MHEYKRIQKEVPTLKNIWIMKPGENSNRGCGITVVKDLKDIKRRLSKKEKHANG
jgi:tubulin---tyrosine ligase